MKILHLKKHEYTAKIEKETKQKGNPITFVLKHKTSHLHQLFV